MMIRTAFLATAIVALPRLAWAQACTLPAPYAIEHVVPASGTTGVPTNVHVRVVHGGSARDAASKAAEQDVIIRPVGGNPVGAKIGVITNAGGYYRTVEVAVSDALAPFTTYEIASKIKPSCATGCIADSYVPLGTFTTGAGPDTTPPVFEGVSEVEVLDLQTCASGACCGPYAAVPFKVMFGERSDDTGIAAFHIYQGGKLVSAYGFKGLSMCSGSVFGGTVGQSFEGSLDNRYVVHAVDLAGNEDQNDVGVTPGMPDCPAGATTGPFPDGGTVGSDANVDHPPILGPDAGGENVLSDDTGVGCAVGGRSGAEGWIMALLVMMGLFLVRRRA